MPSSPDNGGSPLSPSEASIYAEFERLCASRRLPAVVLRTNAGEHIALSPSGGRYRIKLLPTGFPDYELLGQNSRVLFIEFKSAKGRVSSAQEQWRSVLSGMGFGHVVARSALEGVEAAEQFFARAREAGF